jgi:myo-inositol-1(or 4)-monophosphatase
LAHDRATAAADRALLTQAVVEAAPLALARFAAGLDIEHKADGQGPVTDADLAVNAALRTRLRAARPDYGWLSEEDPDGPDRLDAERIFVIDPIDGTRAFIDGKPGWAVAAAVVARGQVTAGVVHLPARGETYAAHLGGGATLNDAPATVGNRAVLEGASAVCPQTMFAPQHWPGGVPAVERVSRSSLAWRLCLVAGGAFDLTVTFRDTWEWDIAAGALIVAEAGGTVSDGFGRPLDFNNPGALAAGVIATNPALHAQILIRRAGLLPG